MMFSVHGGTGEKDRKFVCYQDGGNYYWEQTAPDWREEASTTIKEGLVGHWTFNEGAGDTAYDYSGNNNHGTLSNPNWPQGKGWAMDFDGVSDGVTINSINDIPNRYATLSVWINPSVLGQSIKQISGFRYPGYSNGPLSIRTNPNDYASSRLIYTDSTYTDLSSSDLVFNQPSEWYHLVIVRDNLNFKMYVDGFLNNQTAALDKDLYTSGVFDIGYHNNESFFNGQIDDVRVYDRALSASEITDLYNGKEVSTEGLVGWWAMNEGEDGTCTGGADVCDLSGNANHGTNMGATWQDGRGPVYQQTPQGTALEFSGYSYDYIDIPNDSSLRPDWITVSAWIKPFISARNQDQIVTFESSAYRFSYGASGRFYLLIRDPTSDQKSVYNEISLSSTTNVVPLNEWTHVVGVYSPERAIKLYLNGELSNEQYFTGTGNGEINYPSTTGYLQISKGNEDGWRRPFPGIIDDARIYNRALRPEEIRYLYETTYRE
jgi:hypothetical protein